MAPRTGPSAGRRVHCLAASSGKGGSQLTGGSCQEPQVVFKVGTWKEARARGLAAVSALGGPGRWAEISVSGKCGSGGTVSESQELPGIGDGGVGWRLPQMPASEVGFWLLAPPPHPDSATP